MNLFGVDFLNQTISMSPTIHHKQHETDVHIDGTCQLTVEEEADRVIKYVNGQQYKGRDVRCNDAAEGGKKEPRKSKVSGKSGVSGKTGKSGKSGGPKPAQKTYKKDEWMQFMNPKSMKLKGEIPDFSEEGWAIRKPRKKK